MTIEDMLEKLAPDLSLGGAFLDNETCKCVRSALLAAECMRQSAKTDLSEATKAWDVATKEDV